MLSHGEVNNCNRFVPLFHHIIPIMMLISIPILHFPVFCSSFHKDSNEYVVVSVFGVQDEVINRKEKRENLLCTFPHGTSMESTYMTTLDKKE